MLHFMLIIFCCSLLQDLVGLVISILLLADFSLVLLTFLQLYSYSMVDVLLVLFILPLGILSPFPAGINASGLVMDRGDQQALLVYMHCGTYLH
jgi:hypothetical protein